MPTIQQLVTKGRQDKTTKSKSPALGYLFIAKPIISNFIQLVLVLRLVG